VRNTNLGRMGHVGGYLKDVNNLGKVPELEEMAVQKTLRLRHTGAVQQLRT
jgi:hypothetical protein